MPFANHLCVSNDATCSGIRPCEGCYALLRQRVLAKTILYTGGPLVDRNQPWARAFVEAHARAMHEHVESINAEEARQMEEESAIYAPQVMGPVAGPALAAAQAQAAQGATYPKAQLPCPASLGDKYPCLKPLGHCDHKGKANRHQCLTDTGQYEEWDEEVDLQEAYHKLGILPNVQPMPTAPEEQALAEGGKTPSEEAVAQEILRGEGAAARAMESMGYVAGASGQFVPASPPNGQKTTPEALPEPPVPQAEPGGE